MAANPKQTDVCRLCGGTARLVFQKTLMRKHSVGFFRCSECHCQQTEEPYWLEQAYDPLINATDTGAVHRCIWFSWEVSAFLACFGVSPDVPCLDWGGGNGLFVRIMRDCGFNFFLQDKYVKNHYALNLTTDDHPQQDYVVSTCFEIFEHLPNPLTDLSAVFTPHVDLVIGSTAVFNDQGADWPYLAEQGGQHIFFYSAAGLELIARHFGMRLVSAGGFHIFFREAPKTLSYGAENLRNFVELLQNPGTRLHQGVNRMINPPFSYTTADSEVCWAKAFA